MWTWHDFFDDAASTSVLRARTREVTGIAARRGPSRVIVGGNTALRRKVIGLIEQVICAGGRTFFGTKHSTFSSYIFRLRGYVGAPDTVQRWHNVRYSGALELDVLSEPKPDGESYMQEDPSMWGGGGSEY